MAFPQRLAGKTSGRKAGGLDVDSQFFGQFANQCGFGGFARLDLAAGEFPQARHRPALRPLLDQHTAISIDQRRCNNGKPRGGDRARSSSIQFLNLSGPKFKRSSVNAWTRAER